MLTMALMNESLYLCQVAADKSGPAVMKLPPHSINLGCRHRQTCTFLPPSCWLTYPLFVLHNVVPPVLLCEVRCQHVEAPTELGEHHVVGVTCAGKSCVPSVEMDVLEQNLLCSLRSVRCRLTLPVDSKRIEQLGTTQLSTEQSCIHLHFSRLPLSLTFSSFKERSTQSLEGICLGQHAVNKVNPGSP